MRSEKRFFVYMVVSLKGVIYTGVTAQLADRGDTHRLGIGSQFASKYNATKLVYAEPVDNAEAAFAREKQIKPMESGQEGGAAGKHQSLLARHF